MTKITIERETLEMALAALGEYERHYGWRIGPTVELRAALAQKAEPDEQEVALQEIAEFGQDQLREPRTQEEKEQYAFEDWLASECPSGDVESVQRQWEESAEYLELQDATPAQPADAQPTGQSPCARHCEAPAFEGEIRRLKREATIKDSLTIRPPAPAAVPTDSPAAVEYIAERLAFDSGVRWRDLSNSVRNAWRDIARKKRLDRIAAGDKP